MKALCATCRQATGQGIPNVYPPLAGSERVTAMPAFDTGFPLSDEGIASQQWVWKAKQLRSLHR